MQTESQHSTAAARLEDSLLTCLHSDLTAYETHHDAEALLDALSESLILIGPEAQTTATLRRVLVCGEFQDLLDAAEDVHGRSLRQWLEWQVKTQAYVGLLDTDTDEQRAEEARLRMRVLANDTAH